MIKVIDTENAESILKSLCGVFGIDSIELQFLNMVEKLLDFFV